MTALNCCLPGHTSLFFFLPFSFFISQRCKIGDSDETNLAALLPKGPTIHLVVSFNDGVRDCF